MAWDATNGLHTPHSAKARDPEACGVRVALTRDGRIRGQHYAARYGFRIVGVRQVLPIGVRRDRFGNAGAVPRFCTKREGNWKLTA